MNYNSNYESMENNSKLIYKKEMMIHDNSM